MGRTGGAGGGRGGRGGGAGGGGGGGRGGGGGELTSVVRARSGRAYGPSGADGGRAGPTGGDAEEGAGAGRGHGRALDDPGQLRGPLDQFGVTRDRAAPGEGQCVLHPDPQVTAGAEGTEHHRQRGAGWRTH